MKREDFIADVVRLVSLYLENESSFDNNAQLEVNPVLMHFTIVNGSEMLRGTAESDEIIEQAAGAERSEYEDADDYQASQNPDYYPVVSLVARAEEGAVRPDMRAISAVASRYFAD